MSEQRHLPVFYVKQKLAMATNRYAVHAPTPDGGLGELLGVAQQKRMALKEQVTFYTDETRSQPVFGFRARKKVDLSSGYDISDETGAPLGFFRKDFGASLLRSTFHLEGSGYRGVGQERSMPVALTRRFLDLPLPIHFDFVEEGTGAPLLTVERHMSVRDKYTVTVPDTRVDFRVAAAVAVAVDALMSR